MAKQRKHKVPGTYGLPHPPEKPTKCMWCGKRVVKAPMVNGWCMTCAILEEARDGNNIHYDRRTGITTKPGNNPNPTTAEKRLNTRRHRFG